MSNPESVYFLVNLGPLFDLLMHFSEQGSMGWYSIASVEQPETWFALGQDIWYCLYLNENNKTLLRIPPAIKLELIHHLQS